MKTEKDADYICRLLKQGKGIAISKSIYEADAIVVENGLLTKSEKEALMALIEFGCIKEAAAKTFKTQSTLKKQINSARRKLKAKTNLQAALIAYQLGLLEQEGKATTMQKRM